MSNPFREGDRVELLVDQFDTRRGWLNQPTWRPGYVVAAIWDDSILLVKRASAPRRDRGEPWSVAKVRLEVAHA